MRKRRMLRLEFSDGQGVIFEFSAISRRKFREGHDRGENIQYDFIAASYACPLSCDMPPVAWCIYERAPRAGSHATRRVRYTFDGQLRILGPLLELHHEPSRTDAKSCPKAQGVLERVTLFPASHWTRQNIYASGWLPRFPHSPDAISRQGSRRLFRSRSDQGEELQDSPVDGHGECEKNEPFRGSEVHGLYDFPGMPKSEIASFITSCCSTFQDYFIRFVLRETDHKKT